jgi:hypothetical protein
MTSLEVMSMECVAAQGATREAAKMASEYSYVTANGLASGGSGSAVAC